MTNTSKTILLYGDSFFWGINAATGTKRHERQDRVNTIIQSAVGENVEVVSEGLRGRTMFGENEYFPKRDGLAQFGPIFASHLPIDLVVIMLGTNDLNSRARHSAKDIAAALPRYVSEMNEWCDFMGYEHSGLLVVSPPDIENKALTRFAEIFAGSAALVANTVEEIRNTCDEHGYEFLDSRTVSKSIDTDGIHLDIAETKKLADAISAQAIKMLNLA